MYFQIRELILWPRHDAPPRRIPFKPGKVNIISGASKTGKSAIIPIIDYCLGSGHCAIPTGTIRRACVWFGIVVDTEEGQKLIAREEPGDQQQTENMFLDEASEVVIPDRISRHSTTAKDVRAMLNRLAGVSNLAFEPNGTTGYTARASFRDFMAFIFQPQNVVANPDVLFFKADTNEHREKLKTIFPYVLGAVTPETLLLMWELDRRSKILRRKLRDLENVRRVSARWQSEARSWFHRARELGLFPADLTAPEDWSELVDTLRRIASATFKDAHPSSTGIDAALAETFQLIEVERNLALRVFEQRQRLRELRALKESAASYGAALRIQKDRLSLSTWLRNLAKSAPTGVLTSPLINPSVELEQLCDALYRIESEASRHPAATETVDRELVRAHEALAHSTEELNALRRRLRGRKGLQSDEPSFSIPDIERYLGRLEQALHTYESIGSDSDLAAEVAELRDDVKKLQSHVSLHRIKESVDRALSTVQAMAATIIAKLDAEFPHRPIKLSIADLSVKIIGPEREDWLWEIGSGANWLTYHLAASAALQRYFMQDANHPVPHMLIYDQPSQVYFPRTLAGDQPDPIWRDEDINAVQKVFSTLSDEVALNKGRLQVIVLDHAGEEVWGTIKNIHVVAEWRDGEKLVPESWLAN